MNDKNFEAERQAAIAQMRELNSRSKIYINNREAASAGQRSNNCNPNLNRHPVRANCCPPKNEIPPVTQNINKVCHDAKNSEPSLSEIPILNLIKNRDTALIIGLLLVLINEDADKKLLLALLYILL